MFWLERISPRRAALLAVSIGVLLIAPVCRAQFETATVLGTVRDQSGALVPGAEVSLENLETGIKVAARTNAEGSYQFMTVKIGRYRVRVEAAGFRGGVSEPFIVTINARQRVDMILQVGATTESITVTGAAKLLEVDSSDRGQVVRTDQIANLPLNGRAYADLALLAPGVRKSQITNRDASFNVNGQRMALNNFTMDGLDNNAYATSNQGYSNQVVQASPDALAEFKVQTNNYSAEYGRASGATINASIKSGTNSFRGSAWEFIRNTQLNALGFFKPVLGIKPALTQNQYGFAFGGPIFKDRTFFFLDYEGFRSVTHALSWQTLPTAAFREGIFPVPIKNPFTGEVYTDGRIPQQAITPYARKILEETPGTNLPGVASNYQWMPRGQSYNDKGDVKIDHRFNEKWNAFARLSQRKVNNYEPPSFPGPSGKGGNAHVRVLNQHLALAATYVMDPRSLLEFRMGLSRTDGGKFPDGVGGPGMEELYGITGIPRDPRYYGGLTTINVTGYPGFGRQSSNPQFQNPFVYNPKVNFSRFMGAHTVKAGYEFQAIQTEVDDFNPKYGAENYGGQFSKPSAGTGPTYVYGLADFLMGARDWYELSAPTVANLRQRMHFMYVQDDWKVNPKLTLNLGVRYEYGTPQYERDNRQSNFDPVAITMAPAKNGSIFDRSGVHPDRNNFAPRAGLAYTVTPRTVVRSGYGISYVHFNRLGAENLLAENYPFFFSVRITQQPSMGICSAGADPATCFRPVWMGFPEGLADPKRVPLSNQGWNYYIPADIRTGYVQSWHFTIQREIARDLMLDLAYVGSRSVKLVILGDANQARVNQPGENTPLQQRRLYRNLQNIEQSIPAGTGSYHGLQVKLERRFSNGFYLLNSFTWSKAIDNAAGHLEVSYGDNSRVNFYDIKSEKGISNYNQPFNNTSTVIWDLPYGKGRAFGKSAPALVNAVLGGWRMTAINTMTSGQPFTLRYSAPSNFQVSGMPSYRPNLIGTILTPKPQRSIDNYLSRTNVAAPTDSRYPFGSASRNMTRGYAFYNLDTGLHKQFPFGGEDRRFEVRGEFFNLFNRSNFVVPDATLGSATYGLIRSTFPARVVQLGLKLYF